METLSLSTLVTFPGAKKRRKRIGFGQGSGHGKTAGKGHKGQNARCGGGTRRGFEGGQMPLHRRIPKRGFVTRRKKFLVISLADAIHYANEAGGVFDQVIYLAGKSTFGFKGVKVLSATDDGKGEGCAGVRLIVSAVSASVEKAVRAAGGEVMICPV